MPLQKGYKTPKLLMKSVKKIKDRKVKTASLKKDKPSLSMTTIEGGTGKVKMANMPAKKKKKMGKITYRKSSKPVEQNIIDARGETREAGKQMLESRRLDYEKKLNKMLKNIK